MSKMLERKEETTRVPSAPSISSLMKMLTEMSAGTSTSNATGTSNATFAPSEKMSQKNPAAASAGRAWLVQSNKGVSDGALCYETKTAEGSPKTQQLRRRRHPQRRRTSQGDDSASPPRKNASHLGRSRDSFLLKLVASHASGSHSNAEF